MYTKIKSNIARFGRWMRFDPPGSLTGEGWDSFTNEFREKAPIRYWFSNNFKDIFIYPVQWVIDDVQSWMRYRITKRYHIVKTGLPPGYQDISTIMLHSNFNVLKKHVEFELAIRTYWSECYKTAPWYEKHIPFYFVLKPFNRPDLGLQHLNWASSLDDPALPPSERSPEQAITAREVKELYLWWTDSRVNRQELIDLEYDHQGCGFRARASGKFNYNAPDYIAYKQRRDENIALEAAWALEDDEMLLRLIKIRHELWA